MRIVRTKLTFTRVNFQFLGGAATPPLLCVGPIKRVQLLLLLGHVTYFQKVFSHFAFLILLYTVIVKTLCDKFFVLRVLFAFFFCIMFMQPLCPNTCTFRIGKYSHSHFVNFYFRYLISDSYSMATDPRLYSISTVGRSYSCVSVYPYQFLRSTAGTHTSGGTSGGGATTSQSPSHGTNNSSGSGSSSHNRVQRSISATSSKPRRGSTGAQDPNASAAGTIEIFLQQLVE